MMRSRYCPPLEAKVLVRVAAPCSGFLGPFMVRTALASYEYFGLPAQQSLRSRPA